MLFALGQRQTEVINPEWWKNTQVERLSEAHLIDDRAETVSRLLDRCADRSIVTVVGALGRRGQTEAVSPTRLKNARHLGCADTVAFVSDKQQVPPQVLIDESRKLLSSGGEHGDQNPSHVAKRLGMAASQPPEGLLRKIGALTHHVVPLVHKDDRGHDNGDTKLRIAPLEAFDDRQRDDCLARAGYDLDGALSIPSKPRVTCGLLPRVQVETPGHFPGLWQTGGLRSLRLLNGLIPPPPRALSIGRSTREAVAAEESAAQRARDPSPPPSIKRLGYFPGRGCGHCPHGPALVRRDVRCLCGLAISRRSLVGPFRRGFSQQRALVSATGGGARSPPERTARLRSRGSTSGG